MKKTPLDKKTKRRQRVSAHNLEDSTESEENNSAQKLISRKCLTGSGSSSFLNKYEKEIMQRGYSSDKKQSHRRTAEASLPPTNQHLQTRSRRSRTRSKLPDLKAKSHRAPVESDSSYQYAPPSPKPSIENIPKATHYKYSSQEDGKRCKDSDEEPKYFRNTAAKYYRNIDDNLTYNRLNPNHNIHNNLSASRKYPSITRSRTESNNLLSLREYNNMLNNDSQNSYGYFHGDKNNKLCYISNRPVYYDNSSISETMRYRQQYNELSMRNNSEFRIISKSDTSVAQTAKYCQNYQSDGNNGNIGQVENYLSQMERSPKKSHHNEKSLLDVNPNLTTDAKVVTDKNSEIARLTNVIAKKLQNIGLSIHSTAEPPTRGKSNEDGSKNSSGKISDAKGANSKDSCGAAAEKDTNASVTCLRGDNTSTETGFKKSTEPTRTSKAPKYKQHSKYYLSNTDNNEDNCLYHDSSSARQNDIKGCCYREGEHVNLKPDQVNLNKDVLNCCNPCADGRNIYENLDVCDMQRVYKEEQHAKMIAHNLNKLPTCSCTLNDMKCECGPDMFAKYGLYKNSKRSRSPLTAVSKKTNGVYVFVPLPENSNDPVEMSKHLQNIYNNIIPLNDKQDTRNNGKPPVMAKPEVPLKPQEASKVSETEKPKETPSKDSTDKKEKPSVELPETENETAKVKLINQLLDEYNISLIKQLIQKKSPLKSMISREDIAEELKKLKQQSVSRRHSDLNLNVEQMGKSSFRPRKCPSESSFVMNYTGKTNQNQNNKNAYYTDGRFGVSSPDQSSAFQQLHQQHPMFFDQNREQLNNYQSINMPFTEFVSDVSKYRSPPQGTGQALFYTRTKSPKSYHGQPPPPPPPPVSDPIKPGQPLASSIIDPNLQFQSKANADSRPKSPSQTFNYGLDGATKKHHQQLLNHAHHQIHSKPPFDRMSEPVTYNEAQTQNMASYYPSGDVTYRQQPYTHSTLYDIQESAEYVPPRYDCSPTRYERQSVYDHTDYGHQHRPIKSHYYKTAPETSGYYYDYPDPQTCLNHNHNYRMTEHYHGDRYVDFQDNVQLIDEDEPKQPSILKKLQDVVVKPFSLLFKVETSNPVQNKSHLKGILKPTMDVEEDEHNDYYDHYCNKSGYDKSQSRNTSNYDDMDLDSISQPPIEYVTVVDPYQTNSFESLHAEERRYAESTSTSKNGKAG